MSAPEEASTNDVEDSAVPEELSLGLPELLKFQHDAVMQKLQSHGDLLQQVLKNTALDGLLERMDEPTNYAYETDPISPLASDFNASFSKGSPQREVAGSPSDGVDSIRPRRPSLLSSLRSYTDEDLGRREFAHSRHGDMVRQRFISNILKPMHKGRVASDKLIKRIVKSTYFEMFFAAVVFSNAIFIGVEVQASIDYPGWRPVPFQVVQYTYTFLFTAEITMRLIGHGWAKLFCTDVWYWSCLDVFIVVTSLWEIAVEEIIQNTELAAIGGVSSLKAFRIIRLTRTLRTVQFVRIFRFVVALRTLLTSIVSTLKALAWALILLVLIIYVFAVMFSQAVNDYLQDPESPPLPERELEASVLYFGSLSRTMTSLFMSIAGGTNWEELLFPLELISPGWTLAFLFYMAFTYFAVLNVVTGFFCQGAIESAQADHQTLVQAMLDNKEAHLKRIKELFCEMGQNNDPGITWATFEEKMQEPAVRAYFEALGLDIRDEWAFYKLLDEDMDGVVAVEEFFFGCLKFRGWASAMDIAHVLQDQRWLIKHYGHGQTALEKELLSLKENVEAVSRLVIRNLQLTGKCTVQI